MPVKRRKAKARPTYPPAIADLMGGRTPEFSEEARFALVGLVYFNDFPELSARLQAVAFDLLGKWREQGHA